VKKIRISLIYLVLTLLASCTPRGSVNLGGLLISDIQGCEHISTYTTKLVTGLEGVVTHKFPTGFTMQAPSPDERDCSSEAICVFTATYPDVFPGQIVSVAGKVEEFYPGIEENHNLSRTKIHNPVIKILPGQMNLPEYTSMHDEKLTTPNRFIDSDPEFNTSSDGLDYYESLEFMLVDFKEGFVVGPMNSYNEFIVLPSTKSKINLISENGNLLLQDGDENPEIIMVDVASSFKQKVNVGDQFFTPIVGVMDYSFGNYKIWTIHDPEIKPVEHEKEYIGSENNESLTIASYNIENFSFCWCTPCFPSCNNTIVGEYTTARKT